MRNTGIHSKQIMEEYHDYITKESAVDFVRETTAAETPGIQAEGLKKWLCLEYRSQSSRYIWPYARTDIRPEYVKLRPATSSA